MRAVIFLYETLDIEPLNFKKNYISSIISKPDAFMHYHLYCGVAVIYERKFSIRKVTYLFVSGSILWKNTEVTVLLMVSRERLKIVHSQTSMFNCTNTKLKDNIPTLYVWISLCIYGVVKRPINNAIIGIIRA